MFLNFEYAPQLLFFLPLPRPQLRKEISGNSLPYLLMNRTHNLLLEVEVLYNWASLSFPTKLLRMKYFHQSTNKYP